MPVPKPNFPRLVVEEEELPHEELDMIAEDMARLTKQTAAVRTLAMKQIWAGDYKESDFKAKPSLYTKNSSVPWWLRWAAI